MDDIYEILTQDYGLTPEQIEELMRLGVLAGESDRIIPREREYARELRESRRPQARMYGGVYKEAHPLEFVGAGLKNIAGHLGEWRARERQREILEEQAELRDFYLRNMRSRAPEAPMSFTGGPVPTRVPWDQAPVASMQGNRWNR